MNVSLLAVPSQVSLSHGVVNAPLRQRSGGTMLLSPLEVDLTVPVTLENLLPVAVGFRLTEKERPMLRSEAKDLIRGVIQPKESAYLFWEGIDMDRTWLQLCEIDPREVIDEQHDERIGLPVRLKETTGVAVVPSSMLDDPSPSSASGRKQQSNFATSGSSASWKRMAVKPMKTSSVRWERRSGIGLAGQEKVVLYADFWVRNRSNVDLTIRSVCLGDHHHADLRARPPGTPPDPLVFFLGSYFSMRRGALGTGENPLASSPSSVALTSSSANESRFRSGDSYSHSHSHGHGSSETNGVLNGARGSSNWTTPIELSAVRGSHLVALPNASLMVEVRAAEGRFSRTLMVVVRNAVWLENRSGKALVWTMGDEDESGRVGTGKRVAVHWKGGLQRENPLLSLKREGREWKWSRPLKLNMDGEFAANIYNAKEQQQHIVRVRSRSLKGGSRLLIVQREDRDHPPYRIRNECADISVAFWQASGERVVIPWLMRPGREMGYYWDDSDTPRRSRLLRVEAINHRKEGGRPEQYFDLNIDRVGDHGMVSPSLQVSVAVETATKVVTFSDAAKNGRSSLQGGRLFPLRRPGVSTGNSLLLRQLSSLGRSGGPSPVEELKKTSISIDESSPRSLFRSSPKASASTSLLSTALQEGEGGSKDLSQIPRAESWSTLHAEESNTAEHGRRENKYRDDSILGTTATTATGTQSDDHRQRRPATVVTTTTSSSSSVDSHAPRGLATVAGTALSTSDKAIKRSSSFHVRGTNAVGSAERGYGPPSPRVHGEPDRTSVYGGGGGTATTRVMGMEAFVEELSIDVRLLAIGLSLVDDTPTELLYAHATDVSVNISSSLLNQRRLFNVEMGTIQVDNQLFKPRWPVLLSVMPRRNRTLVDSDETTSSGGGNAREWRPPALTLSVRQSLSSAKQVAMLDRVHLEVKTLSIALEHEIVGRIGRMLRQVMEDPSCDERDERLEKDDEEEWSELTIVDAQQWRTYIGELSVEPVRLMLSFSVGGGNGRREGNDKNSSSSSASSPSPVLERTIAATLGNVESAEFILRRLELRHVFETQDQILGTVQRFYLGQLKRQRLQLVVSNELLGNPSSLLDSIATGARDFFVEPVRSTEGFFAGVGRGSTSLITNTFGGIFSSIGLIPRVLADGLDEVIADDQFALERLAIRGRYGLARSPVQGIYRGVVSAAHGIANGAAGALIDPLQGALQDGAMGFLRGCYRGLIGLALKPATGALDLIAEPAGGFCHLFAIQQLDVPRPLRPPRAFGGQGRSVVRYDLRASLGAEILNAVNRGINYCDEILFEWVELEPGGDEQSSEDLTRLWHAVRRLTRSPGRPVSLTFMARNASKTHVAMTTSRRFLIATIGGTVILECPITHVAETRLGLGSDSVLLVGIYDQEPTSPPPASSSTSPSSSSPQVTLRWPKVECGSALVRDRLDSTLRTAIMTLQGSTAPDQSLTVAAPLHPYELHDFPRADRDGITVPEDQADDQSVHEETNYVELVRPLSSTTITTSHNSPTQDKKQVHSLIATIPTGHRASSVYALVRTLGNGSLTQPQTHSSRDLLLP